MWRQACGVIRSSRTGSRVLFLGQLALAGVRGIPGVVSPTLDPVDGELIVRRASEDQLGTLRPVRARWSTRKSRRTALIGTLRRPTWDFNSISPSTGSHPRSTRSWRSPTRFSHSAGAGDHRCADPPASGTPGGSDGGNEPLAGAACGENTPARQRVEHRSMKWWHPDLPVIEAPRGQPTPSGVGRKRP